MPASEGQQDQVVKCRDYLAYGAASSLTVQQILKQVEDDKIGN